MNQRELLAEWIALVLEFLPYVGSYKKLLRPDLDVARLAANFELIALDIIDVDTITLYQKSIAFQVAEFLMNKIFEIAAERNVDASTLVPRFDLLVTIANADKYYDVCVNPLIEE